jgi:hypothetical protein
MYRTVLFAIAAIALASCATPYAPTGITGGFDAKELREDVYRVSFSGNGYTTNETAQTYWLYRCAELALEKGYYGFEILSDMRFAKRHPADGVDEWADQRNKLATTHLMPVAASAEELAAATPWRLGATTERSDNMAAGRVRVAHGGTFIYVPSYSYAAPRPAFEGDIHLLKRPFEPAPPKLFAANALKEALEGYVTSEKCGLGNICPHVPRIPATQRQAAAALSMDQPSSAARSRLAIIDTRRR